MSFDKIIDGIKYELYTDGERYDYVRDCVEENLQYFNKDFLISNVDDDALEDIHRQFAEGYVNDIEWETNEYGSGRLQEEMEEWGVSTKEEYIEALFKNSFKETGPLQYLIDHFGEDEAIKMALNVGAFDIDEVTEAAVEADGYGHFINSYDGTELEVEIDGETYYAYRIE